MSLQSSCLHAEVFMLLVRCRHVAGGKAGTARMCANEPDLHFFGFLTPGTGAAEHVHHPVWNGAPFYTVLVPYLCAQGASMCCKQQ